MRIASKLALLTTMALAAMALAATNAAATTPIEAFNEDTAEPCDFTLGNCHIHAVGERAFFNSDGTFITSCEEELEGKLAADGTGHITVLNNADHAGSACTMQNCTGEPEGAEEGEWPITGTEETAPHEGTMSLRVCVENQTFPNFTGSHCTLAVHLLEETEGSHHYVLSTDTTCPDDTRTEGSWELEDPTTIGVHDDIELVHP